MHVGTPQVVWCSFSSSTRRVSGGPQWEPVRQGRDSSPAGLEVVDRAVSTASSLHFPSRASTTLTQSKTLSAALSKSTSLTYPLSFSLSPLSAMSVTLSFFSFSLSIFPCLTLSYLSLLLGFETTPFFTFILPSEFNTSHVMFFCHVFKTKPTNCSVNKKVVYTV